MYGYNFLEGGEKAYQHFATQEWLDIVKDSLIHNILCMVSWLYGNFRHHNARLPILFPPKYQPCFLVGCAPGLIFSHTLLLGVVGGAVIIIILI
jgi:hypothetical protein